MDFTQVVLWILNFSYLHIGNLGVICLMVYAKLYMTLWIISFKKIFWDKLFAFA